MSIFGVFYTLFEPHFKKGSVAVFANVKCLEKMEISIFTKRKYMYVQNKQVVYDKLWDQLLKKLIQPQFLKKKFLKKQRIDALYYRTA